LELIGRIEPGASRASIEIEMRAALKQWLRSHWAEMSAADRAKFPAQTLYLGPGGAGITSMRERYEHWLTPFTPNPATTSLTESLSIVIISALPGPTEVLTLSTRQNGRSSPRRSLMMLNSRLAMFSDREATTARARTRASPRSTSDTWSRGRIVLTGTGAQLMSPWFVALFAGPAVLIPLAGYALSRRQVRRARWYGLLLITLAFWSLSYAWELSARDLATKILALKVKYLGVVALPPAWVGFILELVGSGLGRVRRCVFPLSIVALSVFAVLWTNERHGLFWGPMVVADIGDYVVLRGRGPGFWVNIAYTYAVLAAGIGLLLLHAVHSPYLYRRRAGIVIAGTVVPWIGNGYFILHPGERIFDPTPFLFTCTALIAALAVFRYDVLEPVPTLQDARIDWVGDGVIILDPRRRVADLNAAAEAVLGIRRLEAAGTVIDNLLPSWPSGALPDRPMDVTFPERGRQRVFDVRCNPVQSLAGEVTGAVVILRDVTERRAAEVALRESERRYRAVIEQAFDAVWLTDWAGTIVDANPQAAVLLGCSSNELIGQKTSHYMSTTQGPGSMVSEPAREAVSWETEMVGRSGRHVLVAGRSKQIGRNLVVSTFRDITAERAQTELRERLLNEAQTANKLKDEFLATVSHELRTPVNAVVGWTNMLVRRRVEDPPVAHALAVIERNALAQARLIEDLLDLSQLASAGLRLLIQPSSVAVLIQEAADAVAPSAEAKHLTMQFAVASDLPDLMVDPDRLRQAIVNLLTNAVKFTPDGGRIAIRASATARDLEVVVADTGIGIAPDFLPHIFDAFRQADSSDNRNTRGLGLGLMIVRRIVEAHDGRIEAESEGLGRGTTFRLSLPVTRAATAPADATASDSPGWDN
jgi:PAS domain S-box-containing protein